MQIPILNGIVGDTAGEYRTTYPINRIPVPKSTGISKGFLKPAEGIVYFGTGPGQDRGGIVWNGVMYRAMGTKLVVVAYNGTVSILADIGSDGLNVTFDYSFDYLAIASAGKLFYWNGVLTQVTDVDLGIVKDFIWVDGYFMTTDGLYLAVTDLNNPFSVNPFKYGTAEADPDPIVGMLKIRNEPYIVGRYTIEVFDNVGGDFFPFQRIPGAQIQRGALGTFAFCQMTVGQSQGVAFLGGGRNESFSVWFGLNGTSIKLATREIDIILEYLTESQLAAAVVESRITKSHNFLYVHLPVGTLVYDAAASEVVGEPVWFYLTSILSDNSLYKARNFIYCYDKWLSGDPTPGSSNIGYFVETLSSHYGQVVGWEFSTLIVYNGAKNAIFHELELIGLPGNVAFGVDPTIWTSYSTDGETFSVKRAINAGKQGERQKRLVWLQNGTLEGSVMRIQKFTGTSDAHLSIAALEARLEPLAN